jgi:phage-related protein
MLYQRSQLFRDIISTVFDIGAKVVGTMGDAIVILGGVAQTVFDAIDFVVTTSIDAMQAIFAGILEWLRKPFESFQAIAETVWDVVLEVVETCIDAVKIIFDGVLAFLKTPFETFQTIAETVFDVVAKAVGTAIDAIALIFSTVQAMLEAPWKAFEETIRRIMETVKGIVQGAVDFINGILKGIGDTIAGLEKTASEITPWSVAPPATGGTRGVAVMGLGRRSGRAAGDGGSGTTVNVNVQSADPQEVMRAIRRWSRNNGGSGPFTRGLDRSTA